MSTAKIWWIASYPKSGNTWFRMFMAAYMNGGVVRINRPYGMLVDDIQTYFHQAVSPIALPDLSDHDQMLIRPAALFHLCALASTSVPMYVKTHFANCDIVGIPTIPRSLTYGAVYIVRDPRDVAISFARHRAVSVDEIIANMNRRDQILRRKPLYHHLATWSDHVQSWAHADFPVHVIRYEDLLVDAVKEFRGVLEFLKHEVTEDLLQKSVEATSFEALRAQEQARGFREATHGDFFANGRSVWRDELAPYQINRIEQDHQEIMREWRYI